MRGDVLALNGGLFAAFAFVHFVVDWVLQTHAEAMAKTHDRLVRARHCAVYAAGFLPLFLWLGWSSREIAVGLAVLFVSHFVEDSYVPVYLWARHVRRDPMVRALGREGFKMWADTTLGKILLIGVDQIVHLTFLWVLVFLEMSRVAA